MPSFRKLGITLKEDEVQALNIKLQREGFASLGEMVRSYCASSFSPTEANLDSLACKIASKMLVSKHPFSDDRANHSTLGRWRSQVRILTTPSLITNLFRINTSLI